MTARDSLASFDHGLIIVDYGHSLAMIDHERPCPYDNGRPWSDHGFYFTNMVDHGQTMVSWWSDHGQSWSVTMIDHGQMMFDHDLTRDRPRSDNIVVTIQNKT